MYSLHILSEGRKTRYFLEWKHPKITRKITVEGRDFALIVWLLNNRINSTLGVFIWFSNIFAIPQSQFAIQKPNSKFPTQFPTTIFRVWRKLPPSYNCRRYVPTLKCSRFHSSLELLTFVCINTRPLRSVSKTRESWTKYPSKSM